MHKDMPEISTGSATSPNLPGEGGWGRTCGPVKAGAPGCLIRPGRALEED